MSAVHLTERIEQVVRRVLFSEGEGGVVDGEIPAGAVVSRGLTATFVFHPRRLEAERAEVEALVRELVQDGFFRSKGGGWSFLQLPFDRNGAQWGEHHSAEMLFVLAMGLGRAGYCLPREMWIEIGAPPYVWFDLEGPPAPPEKDEMQRDLVTAVKRDLVTMAAAHKTHAQPAPGCPFCEGEIT